MYTMVGYYYHTVLFVFNLSQHILLSSQYTTSTLIDFASSHLVQKGRDWILFSQIGQPKNQFSNQVQQLPGLYFTPEAGPWSLPPRCLRSQTQLWIWQQFSIATVRDCDWHVLWVIFWNEHNFRQYFTLGWKPQVNTITFVHLWCWYIFISLAIAFTKNQVRLNFVHFG